MVSALNILNEAEINYKAARNKRLHVELALIRLSYLQQAISLSHDSQGISKKKLVESAKPVALRRLPLIEFKADTQKANKQKTESQETGVQKVSASDNNSVPIDQLQSKLIIQEPVISNKTKPENGSVSANPVKKISPKGNKIGSLENIRQQIANGQSENENNKIIPLTDELLKANWEDYTKILKEKKSPASQSFELARLTITSENSFEVLSNNNLEHRFIEQERRFLSEFLQEKFNNRTLTYSLSVSENPVHHVPIEKTINKREQFLQIVEQYPIIRDLKDRLKLELDY
jgi:DNA polymerase-3 subunit gamma/tau